MVFGTQMLKAGAASAGGWKGPPRNSPWGSCFPSSLITEQASVSFPSPATGPLHSASWDGRATASFRRAATRPSQPTSNPDLYSGALDSRLLNSNDWPNVTFGARYRLSQSAAVARAATQMGTLQTAGFFVLHRWMRGAAGKGLLQKGPPSRAELDDPTISTPLVFAALATTAIGRNLCSGAEVRVANRSNLN